MRACLKNQLKFFSENQPTSNTTTEWEIYTTLLKRKRWKESLCLLQEWESLQIKDSDCRIHCRFTFRCLSKDLIPVSVKLKSKIKTRRAKQIIHKAERQLLQDRVKAINNILWDNSLRLDRCRSRLASLVTPPTMEKCASFINKVRESRHIKIR